MRLGNSDHLFRYSFSYQDCQKFWRSIGNWFNAVKECERKEHETNNAEQKNANLPQTCNLSLEVFSCKMTHYFFVEFVILSDVLILISILFFTWNKLLALLSITLLLQYWSNNTSSDLLLVSNQMFCDLNHMSGYLKSNNYHLRKFRYKNSVLSSTKTYFFLSRLKHLNPLTINVPSYRNQSVDLLCESTDWFLYDGKIDR